MSRSSNICTILLNGKPLQNTRIIRRSVFSLDFFLMTLCVLKIDIFRSNIHETLDSRCNVNVSKRLITKKQGN